MTTAITVNFHDNLDNRQLSSGETHPGVYFLQYLQDLTMRIDIHDAIQQAQEGATATEPVWFFFKSFLWRSSWSDDIRSLAHGDVCRLCSDLQPCLFCERFPLSLSVYVSLFVSNPCLHLSISLAYPHTHTHTHSVFALALFTLILSLYVSFLPFVLI